MAFHLLRYSIYSVGSSILADCPMELVRRNDVKMGNKINVWIASNTYLVGIFTSPTILGNVHCTIMPYPASCFFNDTECIRGGNARALQLTKNGYALICGLAIIVFMSLLVYAVYSQEKKGDRYAVSSQHVTRTYTRKAGKFDHVICCFPSQLLQLLIILSYG